MKYQAVNPSLLGLGFQRRLTIIIGGGGVGGSFAAGALSVLCAHPVLREARYTLRVVSTSVGSLIGAALMSDELWVQTPEQIQATFVQRAQHIFERVGLPWPLSAAPYDIQRVRSAAHASIGDVRFSDSAMSPAGRPRLVPIAVDVSKADVRLKLWGVKTFVADAVAASCAAPTYFAPHLQCLDGALISNTPAALASMLAPADDYIVIRTGNVTRNPDALKKVTPFGISEMIGTMIHARDNLELDYASNELGALVLQPPSDFDFALDDASTLTLQKLFLLGRRAAYSLSATSWLDTRDLSVRSKFHGLGVTS